MRSSVVLLSFLSSVLSSPVPPTTPTDCSSSTYGNWSSWQEWEPSWLASVAPQIVCSTDDTSNPVSPLFCANCSQPTLIAFLAQKWQPYVDAVFSNIQTRLQNLTLTQSHVDTVIAALQTQFAGDLIVSIERVLYTPPVHSVLTKRHGNSTGSPLAAAYENYTYQGCITNFASKALLGSEDTNFGNLTNEKCIDYCRERGFPVAATQSGSQCFCGKDLGSTTLIIEEHACATSCTGDDAQVCGDNQKLSVYATFNVSAQTFSPAVVREAWEEVGCMTDGTSGNHSLTGAAYACLGLTAEMCMDFCDVMGYPIAGLEYGGECYCGNKFEQGGGTCTSGCSLPCIGDQNQTCGGDWVMNVYQRIDSRDPVSSCPGIAPPEAACTLSNCSEYNFTAAWTGHGVNWNTASVPTTTDVCSQPCEVLEYFPWFVWQMHENIRIKIADRLTLDWPARIAALVGEQCSCEIEDIEKAIEGSGYVSYGLDGIADSWVCELVSLIGKI